MNECISAKFEIVGWDEEQYNDNKSGLKLAKATVRKTFNGDIVGESEAELLTCQADPDDFAAGAGYVASEQVTGQIDGMNGSFVVQHGGLSGNGVDEKTFGQVVPGSATDELEGLRGDVELSQDEDGVHTFELDYSIDR